MVFYRSVHSGDSLWIQASLRSFRSDLSVGALLTLLGLDRDDPWHLGAMGSGCCTRRTKHARIWANSRG